MEMVGTQSSGHPAGTSPASVEFLDQVHLITNLTDLFSSERGVTVLFGLGRVKHGRGEKEIGRPTTNGRAPENYIT